MKVILLKDVPNVGHRYDVKDVADGFARNVLIPKHLADLATPAAVARIEKIKKEESVRSAAQEKELLAELAKLNDLSLSCSRKASATGHLFAGLKKDEILKIVSEQGLAFREENIVLEQAIKTTGKHEIPVHVGDKKGVLVLEVKAA